MPPRKPVGGQSYAGPLRRSTDYVPPTSGGAQSLKAQVIPITEAIASNAHVTHGVRRRILTDWLRGIDELVLGVMYREGKKRMPRQTISAILRQTVRRTFGEQDQEIRDLRAKVLSLESEIVRLQARGYVIRERAA